MEIKSNSLVVSCATDLLTRNIGTSCTDLYGLFTASAERKKYDKWAGAEYCCRVSEAITKGGFAKGLGGTILVFTGKVYEEITPSDINCVIGVVMERANVPSLYIVQLVSVIAKKCIDALSSCPFVPQSHIFSLENCVLDTDDMSVHEHGVDWQCMKTMPVSYNKDAKCPLFRKFLNEILPDKDTQMVFQEFIGAALVDRRKYSIEKMMFALGNGSNGKSCAFDAITNVFGSNNISNFSLADLTNTINKPEYNLAMMDGNIMNITNDMSSSMITSNRFKELVSGQAVPARNPCGKPYMMYPCLMAAALNEMPKTADISRGNTRRILIIPFEQTILEKDQDTELGNKLMKEKEGIFQWIIEGCERIKAQKGHFTHSDLIEKYNIRNKIDSNSILSWLQDEGYDANGSVECPKDTLKLLYGKYCEYCKDGGYKPFSIKNVAKVLRDSGFEQSRNSSGICFTLRKNDIEGVDEEEKNEALEELPF